MGMDYSFGPPLSISMVYPIFYLTDNQLFMI
jgi:hypothetical protein